MLKRLLLSFLLVSGVSITTVACSDDPDDGDNPVLDAGEDANEPDADAEEPDAEEPDAEEPDAEEPDAEEPDAEEPDAEEPDAEEPDAEEPDAEEPDADEPDVDPGPTTGELDDPDITAESCDAIDTVGCFVNADCGASEVCFDVSRGNDVACCVPGTRGTYELGETCDPENGQLQCASSICIQDDPETFSVCSDACESNDDCVAPVSECVFGLCLAP